MTNAFPATSQPSLLELLKPQAIPYQMIRIGGKCDGAYLVPDDICGIEACFSPGVSNRKDFEDELALKYKIASHMCDFSSDVTLFKTPLITGLQTFEKKWLDPDIGPHNISLAEWIQKYSPNNMSDLMLQIDIEGAEYKNLLALERQTLQRFRIIVIELHGLQSLNTSSYRNSKAFELLMLLNRSHKVVHAHPNNCSDQFIDQESGANIPYTLELTLLRTDRMSNTNSVAIEPLLPHPLDISRNMLRHPPIHLNSFWGKSSEKSVHTELKVLSDTCEFYEWKIHDLEQRAIPGIARLYNDSISRLYSKLSSPLFYSEPPRSIHGSGETRQELAHDKPYILSSRYAGYPVSGKVHESETFFFHTGKGERQVVTIDLGQAYSLECLEIRNRLDSCQHRARVLFCVVHNRSEYDISEIQPIHLDNSFLLGSLNFSMTPLFGVVGRFVSLMSVSNDYFHLSSIKIYGQ